MYTYLHGQVVEGVVLKLLLRMQGDKLLCAITAEETACPSLLSEALSSESWN